MIPAMISPDAMRGSHRFFCSSVPPVRSARVRISGRVMSEPPMPSDPRDSSSVDTTMPSESCSPPDANPSYSSGTERPNAAQLGQPGDEVFGNIGIGAVHVLGDRTDAIVGEAPEGLRDELEVV